MRKIENLSKQEVLCVKLFDGTKKILTRIAKKKSLKVSDLARKFIEKGISTEV